MMIYLPRMSDLRASFTPQPDLPPERLAHILAIASDELLRRFAQGVCATPTEASLSHHVTCRTTFNAATGEPIYTLAVEDRRDAYAAHAGAKTQEEG